MFRTLWFCIVLLSASSCVQAQQRAHRPFAYNMTALPEQASDQLPNRPPLDLEEVKRLLKGSVTPKRVATLVERYGVSFALSDDTEKELRKLGADGDLLLVISKKRVQPAPAIVAPSPQLTQPDLKQAMALYDAQRYEEALPLLRILADQGNADAQDTLGWMYGNSLGVKKDDAEAVRWYRKAADQGNAIAQTNLAWMYGDGLGVEKDDAEAVRWYRKAADQGNANAQKDLGVMYENGRGLQKDDAEAVRWYRMAAEQGDADAQNGLGWRYEHGLGVQKDDAEAVRWFRKAADKGDARAQNNLGSMYETGRGVEKNEAEAVRWYRKAADQGNANAQTNLKRLGR